MEGNKTFIFVITLLLFYSCEPSECTVSTDCPYYTSYDQYGNKVVSATCRNGECEKSAHATWLQDEEITVSDKDFEFKISILDIKIILEDNKQKTKDEKYIIDNFDIQYDEGCSWSIICFNQNICID